MKGIVPAGGSGTWLHPITIGVSKQLQPVYYKSMIHYQRSALMLAQIRDVLLIPDDIAAYQRLLGDGSDLCISITYAEQPSPDGLAQAFLIGKECSGDDGACRVLGENIFYGQSFGPVMQTVEAKSLFEDAA